MYRSIATISSPEFINLQPLDINPLMSSAEIKVLYLGENRNHTYIDKATATEMAKTLRGAPIVGYYREEKEDFSDHGQEVIIDSEGIKFNCKTVPYGFVAPDAKVWFQEFQDTNSFGENIVREYLMTTGYLWTGQYPECKSAVEGDGKPHSMELDEATCKGQWEVNRQGMEFYIINDAIFSKLCILGEDVEPCFEGSKISAPEVSASYTKVDDTFKYTLFTMMQDLKSALEGGQQMNDNIEAVVEENTTPVIEEPVVESEPEAPVVDTETPVVEDSLVASQEPVVIDEPEAEAVPENPEPEVTPEPEPSAEPEVEPEQEEPIPSVEEQYTALQTAYTALEETLTALQSQYTALESAHAELVEFKRQIDDAKKDEMINKFYMLTDEDKADVLTNKANYSVEEIEEKLSVICVRKKVNFDLEDNSKNHINTEPSVVFNLNAISSGSTKPAWLSAVDIHKNQSI